MNATMKDGNLVITVKCDGVTPYVSKSAIAKAIKAGQDPAKLPANSVATSGGFALCGGYKFSLNVIKA